MISTQAQRNTKLLAETPHLGQSVGSHVRPFRLPVDETADLSPGQIATLQALEIEAARIAIRSVGELSKLNEVDHLGGGLDLIPALQMTLSMIDYEAVNFTIENAHTSIGYYAALASRGFLDPQRVIDAFRRSLDIAGHVSWVPGGTQLSGGRLGVMIPAAVGQALGQKARYGEQAWLICHCGDAGWISGQALNGFIAASQHRAPVTFVMHRNGIQLSNTTARIMNRDPRAIIRSLGIEIIEIPSIHDPRALYRAYRQARALARAGQSSLIFPVGYAPESGETLTTFAERYNLTADTVAFAAKNNVDMNTSMWTPGALMSYRDVPSMLECLFYVNNLPGGRGHHDGHLKGRDVEALLAHPMLQRTADQEDAYQHYLRAPAIEVITHARPAPGTSNLIVSDALAAAVKLPPAGDSTSPRTGVQAGYELIAKSHPRDFFIIDCDLAPSTKVDKARATLDSAHQFEMSIAEQVSAIMANGLAMSSRQPQLVVFATFAAFFEGIAREGFEMWRYQRNLNGVNEGLNVTFHLSHVGACTGRDHFSGWSLDWINLAIGYLPYLHRFYAPADARAAFIAVRDLAAHYGGHIIGIPRDNLPILTRQDSSEPLWNPNTPWEPVTGFRSYPGAKKAILVLGAPAYIAAEAAEQLHANNHPVDVHIINGLPLAPGVLRDFATRYPEGLVTVEDGIIASEQTGLLGFAGMVASATRATPVPLHHIGISDPRIAPSDGHLEVWEHFGITTDTIIHGTQNLCETP